MDMLDLNTVQLLSTTILIVLSTLMILLWAQNINQSASFYWGLFSVLLTIDAILVTFPDLRNMDGYVYLFNATASFSYFALMIGCFIFAGLKLNKWWLLTLLLSCLFVNGIGAYVEFSDQLRRSVIILFSSIALVFSAYAISQLSSRIYQLEKNFMLVLLTAHLAIHGFWVYLGFNVSSASETVLSRSVTPVYLVLIFIIIALLLLGLGKIRAQLELENSKSVKMKKALSNATYEANVANKSKSVFLTNMSHELRTPLNIILGFSEAMKLGIAGSLNDKQVTFVESIHFGGKRLLALINDLLHLSNIESGNLEKNFKYIKPRDLIQQNIKQLETIGKKYHSSVYFIDDLEECSEDDYVLVDTDWITQTLTALFDNAAKYGSKGGGIWLNGFARNSGYVRITIKDEGRGILEGEQANVFKPFNRAGIDNKVIEGTGTGLAIVKGLVDAMGGRIGLESRLGSGSTFWLDLPLVRD